MIFWECTHLVDKLSPIVWREVSTLSSEVFQVKTSPLISFSLAPRKGSLILVVYSPDPCKLRKKKVFLRGNFIPFYK